jgi:hexosaminidase
LGISAGPGLAERRSATPDQMIRMDRIIPKPASVQPESGVFTISPDTFISIDRGTYDIAQLLVDMLAPALGRSLPIVTNRLKSNCIALKIDPSLSQLGEEGYRAVITPERVELIAQTRGGLFWGLQTLRQLLPTQIFSPVPVPEARWEIPCGIIEDHPRFSWRGMMLDCSRHFMPIEFIYKWIDLLAIHKMNIFHWHLTDDQGWRIEIKKYPKLTEIGAWRNETLIGHALSKEPHTYDGVRHGGYYTQEQIRSVVKYAAARNITVVPEIELPGHSQAAIAAYPNLGNTGRQIDVWNSWGINPNILNVEESTISFYQDVLSEVMELFPSPFIHIGGDEAIKDQWKASDRAQARMTELGLKDEHELQSWFIRRIDEFLTSHGRKLVGWDEILEGGLASGAIVMSWRGEEGGIAAANLGNDVVMTPSKWVYFDHYQSENQDGEPLAIGGFISIEKVYGYEPVPAAIDEKAAIHVRGAQGNLWTEYVPDPSHAEYMVYPRACALAEVVWSGRQPREFPEFLRRLNLHVQRLKLLGVNYHPLDF